MNIEQYEQYKTEMMLTLEEDNILTTAEWQEQFYRQYPQWNTGYWGDKFRNTQQTLSKQGYIELIGGRWTILRFYDITVEDIGRALLR